jgi:hypothetical protein
MQYFRIQSLFKITGIGSASGIIYKDNSLFIISDNSSFLYNYNLQENTLTKIPITENPQENIAKKDKFNFESIALKGNKLHILGSGSTSKREKRITYNLDTEKIVEKDLTKLYKQLKETASISDDELNIEGALFNTDKWYLFQRGNGANSKNGIFILNDNLKDSCNIEFIPIQLPKIKHIETSFTDAILVEDKIYFLATAEDTTSTYDDGEILGSIIGRIDCKTFKIDFTQKISATDKFEGLTLHEKSAAEIAFLICQDNDSDILETNIYKLTLDLEHN